MLRDRFPNIRQLPPDENHNYDDATLLQLLEPYLNWKLLEIDTSATDLLIGISGEGSEKLHLRELVILRGRAVMLWLRQQGNAET